MMTSRETMSLATVLLSIIPIVLALTVFIQDEALAYDRLGFTHEWECLNAADLELKEGLLNSTSYQKLVDICKHADA